MAREDLMDAEVAAVLRRAATGADPALKKLAAELGELLHREIAEFPDDPRSRDDTRRACLGALRTFAEALRDGTPAQHLAVPPDQLAAARALARSGRTVRPLMRMFHLAHGASFDLWDREIAAADVPVDVADAARRRAHELMFGWIDTITTAVSDEFEAERRRWSRSPEAIRQQLVHAILGGEEVDVDAAGRDLGYDVRRHHLAVIAWSDESGASAGPADVIASLAAILGIARPLVIRAGPGEAWGWLGLDAPPEAAALDALVAHRCPPDVSAALGEPGTGLDGFRSSHEDAASAARVARLAGARRRGIVTRFHNVEVGALFVDHLDRARRFVEQELGTLAIDDDEHARLRATLAVYLAESARPSVTAGRLGIHANTVRRRVIVCRDLLGHDFNVRSTELHLALRLAETLGEAVLSAPQPS